MEGVLLVLVVLLVIGLAVSLLRGRRGARPDRGSDQRGSDSSAAPQTELAEIDEQNAPTVSEDQVLLVPMPNKRYQALALGSEQALAVLESSGMTRRAKTQGAGPLPQVVRSVIAAGGGEATRRANAGIDQGRIVALSKETVKQMKVNKQLIDKAGKPLALYRNKKGIAHVARFDKAGAKALTASNAATLAMTAALSQQLAAMQEQLTEIQDTLDGMVQDSDRKRLAEVVATNKELETVARAIQRRGEMTEADWDRVAAQSYEVTSHATEAEFKLSEVLQEDGEKLNRHERVEKLEDLRDKERLEYWLALQVQAELAQNRRDLLYLYWEQSRHPETARELAEDIRQEIKGRQQRFFELGEVLDELSDPEGRTFTDRVRVFSKRQLEKQDEVIARLLRNHRRLFSGPNADPNAVIPEARGDVLLVEAQVQAKETEQRPGT